MINGGKLLQKGYIDRRRKKKNHTLWDNIFTHHYLTSLLQRLALGLTFLILIFFETSEQLEPRRRVHVRVSSPSLFTECFMTVGVCLALIMCPSAETFLCSVYVFWLLGGGANKPWCPQPSSYIIFIHAYVWDSSSAFRSPHRHDQYLNGLMQPLQLVRKNLHPTPRSRYVPLSLRTSDALQVRLISLRLCGCIS